LSSAVAAPDRLNPRIFFRTGLPGRFERRVGSLDLCVSVPHALAPSTRYNLELVLLGPFEPGVAAHVRRQAAWVNPAFALARQTLSIHIPSIGMEGDMGAVVHRLREKTGESEKITINLGFVDLGQIDLLVREGFYSNRTDMIRTAIRAQLARHADDLKQTIVRQTLEIGLRRFSRADLEKVKDAGEKLSIKVIGLTIIADDVPCELACATIEAIIVLGSLQASEAVKTALAERIR
jgi:Arc/MetJ-type ribon-helix-helix transcriptional regulator